MFINHVLFHVSFWFEGKWYLLKTMLRCSCGACNTKNYHNDIIYTYLYVISYLYRECQLNKYKFLMVCMSDAIDFT